MTLLLLLVRLGWLHWETSSGGELGCPLWVTSGPVQVALQCCCLCPAVLMMMMMMMMITIVSDTTSERQLAAVIPSAKAL